MFSDRFAVIDLGSNTFHLLICEVTDGHTLETICKKRVYVKLASGGLDLIPEENIERGIDALQQFAALITEYEVHHVRAIGTAALREAKNGTDVVRRFSEASGIIPEIIDGQKEAQYILQGTRAARLPLTRPSLIMDIGGGSVEFILFEGDKILFKGSYKIGVAVLYRMFHHHDPMAASEIEEMEAYLFEQLEELIGMVSQIRSYDLIGASGSFEVIHDMMPRHDQGQFWAELKTQGLTEYLSEVISTNLSGRRAIPEIPVERVDYIVVAYILIRFVWQTIPPERLFYCDFALKEGVLAEMLQKSEFRYI